MKGNLLTKLLQQAIAAQPAKEWPTFDGRTLDRKEFLSSSQVANCLRQTYFEKNGYTPKEGRGWGTGTNGFAERGHAVEAWLVEQLRRLEPLGYEFWYIGDEQVSFYEADIGVSGTPDGIMWSPARECYLLEFKSIDPRTNKNNLPKRKHVVQCQQNVSLVQQCIDIKIKGIILFYIDASNLFDVEEFHLPVDPAIAAEAVSRAKILWAATDPEQVEPEGLLTGDCDTCPFTQHCSATLDISGKIKAAGQTAENFLAESPDSGETLSLTPGDKLKIAFFLKERASVKLHEAERDTVADDVRKLVVGHNGIISVSGSVLTTRTEAGRQTFDTALAKEDGVNVDKYMKRGKPFIVLNVKEAKQ